MGFRHSNKIIFQLVAIASVAIAICFWSVKSTWGSNFLSSRAMLAFGFGFTYSLATGFLAVASTKAVASFQRFPLIDKLPKSIAVLTAIVVLVIQSSAIFGAYFNLVENQGFESQQLVDWDRYLRQLLRLQLVIVPLIAAFEAKRARWWDLTFAILMALFVAVFVLA